MATSTAENVLTNDETVTNWNDLACKESCPASQHLLKINAFRGQAVQFQSWLKEHADTFGKEILNANYDEIFVFFDHRETPKFNGLIMTMVIGVEAKDKALLAIHGRVKKFLTTKTKIPGLTVKDETFFDSYNAAMKYYAKKYSEDMRTHYHFMGNVSTLE